MLLPGAEESTGALLHRLERMERRLGAASPDPPPSAEHASPPPAPAAVPHTRRRAANPPTEVTPAKQPPRSSPMPPREVVDATAQEPGPSGPRSTSEGGALARAGSREESGAAEESGSPTGVGAQAVEVGGQPAAPGSLDAAAVRRVWDEVLATVRRSSPRAWAVVREASVRDVQGDEIVLLFQHAVHANMLSAQSELLVESVREVLGGTWSVRAELGGTDSTDTLPGLEQPRHSGPPRSPTAMAGSPPPAGPPSAVSTARSGPAEQDSTASNAKITSTARGGRQASSAPSAADGSAEASRSVGGPGSDGHGSAGSDGPSVPAAPAPAAAADGWPETAKPGGSGDQAPPAPSRSAAGAKGVRPSGGRGASAATGRASASQGSSGTVGLPPDEPPVNPDDRPLAAAYPGFDPGDEPVDDVTTVRESSEEQAMRGLSQHFNIEKIGEPNPRS